jgi:hypothetical protein
MKALTVSLQQAVTPAVTVEYDCSHEYVDAVTSSLFALHEEPAVFVFAVTVPEHEAIKDATALLQHSPLPVVTSAAAAVK